MTESGSITVGAIIFFGIIALLLIVVMPYLAGYFQPEEDNKTMFRFVEVLTRKRRRRLSFLSPLFLL